MKKIMLIIGLCFSLIGLGGCTPTQEISQCERCDENVLKKYIFDNDDMYLCPECAYDVLETAMDPNQRKCVHCGDFFNWKLTRTGLSCEYCEDEYIRGCAICGESCETWNQDLDFVLCEWCLASIFRNQEMQDYVLYDD